MLRLKKTRITFKKNCGRRPKCDAYQKSWLPLPKKNNDCRQGKIIHGLKNRRQHSKKITAVVRQMFSGQKLRLDFFKKSRLFFKNNYEKFPFFSWLFIQKTKQNGAEFASFDIKGVMLYQFLQILFMGLYGTFLIFALGGEYFS